MSSVDEREDGGITAHAKGAPERVLERSTEVGGPETHDALDEARRDKVLAVLDRWAAEGLRVLAVARRRPRRLGGARQPRGGGARAVPSRSRRPVRPPAAGGRRRRRRLSPRRAPDSRRHRGLRAHGGEDRPGVGIAREGAPVVTGEELEDMTEDELDALLRDGGDVVFARSSPEAKLRIAESLLAEGHVVAMTGDGVSDAPALRRADIGVAMGRSGTDVAREASTMVLTDDNFSTIVAAVAAGRRVFQNVRKFVFYILAHTTPEVVPFLRPARDLPRGRLGRGRAAALSTTSPEARCASGCGCARCDLGAPAVGPRLRVEPSTISRSPPRQRTWSDVAMRVRSDTTGGLSPHTVATSVVIPAARASAASSRARTEPTPLPW